MPSCCAAFLRAEKAGSYGGHRLILYVETLGYQLGYEPQAIHYCPWCGSTLRPPPVTIILEAEA